jgi:signal transduction histidine kinase
MNKLTRELGDEYMHTLHAYLGGAGEPALRQAYELGRRALVEGVGLLDMVTVAYTASQDALLRGGSPEQVKQKMRATQDFMVESLSAFELTHRSYDDANMAVSRLNDILEEEIKRIAHALHDDASQLLASLYIALAEWSTHLQGQERERMQGVRKILDQIETQLRQLSHELRPSVLDDFGLVPALEFLAERVQQRTGLVVAVEGGVGGRLPPTLEITLYRIVQEGLSNVAKHASATHARIRLGHRGKVLRCMVCDNGCGFNAAAVMAGKVKRGLGMLAIQERVHAVGGTLHIDSTPKSGTCLSITIPVTTWS